MGYKEVTILINDNGTVELDQAGWNGKECSGEVDDLVKALGTQKTRTKKTEYYKDQKIRVQQRW